MKQFHKAIVNIWFNLNHIGDGDQPGKWSHRVHQPSMNLPYCPAESAWASVNLFRKWTANYKFDPLVTQQWWLYVIDYPYFSVFGMSKSIFSTVRKAGVFVRVHMEHLDCSNSGKWGQIQNRPNFQKFPKLPCAEVFSASSSGVLYFAICCKPLCYLCRWMWCIYGIGK